MSRVISFCVVLLLALTSVVGVQRKLNSIRDEHLPTDILCLLHWFANQIYIDNRNVIRLNIDISEHGSHYYGNYERLLEQLPRGYKYYTIGNINEAPSHSDHSWTRYAGQNKARIIFSATQENLGYVDRVYITRHYDTSGANMYDPDETYEVTTSFLTQIRKYSLQQIQQMSGVSQFRNTSAGQSQGFQYNQQSYIPQPATRATDDCDCLRYVIAIVIIIVMVFAVFASQLRVNK